MAFLFEENGNDADPIQLVCFWIFEILAIQATFSKAASWPTRSRIQAIVLFQSSTGPKRPFIWPSSTGYMSPSLFVVSGSVLLDVVCLHYPCGDIDIFMG